MNVISQKITKLRNVVKLMPFIIEKIVEGEEQFIAELNRIQLKGGRRADGGKMPNYKPGSKSPSAPGSIKLFDTGEFYASLDPLFDADGIDITSTDPKSRFLETKYKPVLGLTPESLEKLKVVILPKIIDQIRALT